MPNLRDYLQDPLLRTLYQEIRAAGSLRSISVDLTHKCNLRCDGCYYFAEGMDQQRTGGDETAFDHWILQEKERGTNFVTIVGGEPALVPERIRKIYRHFKTNVATNGLIPIPREGMEDMPIGIAVWGDHETDARLRGDGQEDFFTRALANYRGDERAFWYYTVAPGCAHEVESVVGQCVSNGNRVLFNYYSDVEERGGELGYRQGFEAVQTEIDRMIARYPKMIFTTQYFNQVVTSKTLFGQRWGFDVCTNLSTNHPGNFERFESGQPYNPHFRAYNADFSSTRRCCTGVSRDCASCFDTWEHFSWIMIHMRKQLGSKADFTRWLTTMYVFYLVNRIVNYEKGVGKLPEIHRVISEIQGSEASTIHKPRHSCTARTASEASSPNPSAPISSANS
jgi:hypothetical protein